MGRPAQRAALSIGWQINGTDVTPLPQSRELTQVRAGTSRSATSTGVYEFEVVSAAGATAFLVSCKVTFTGGEIVDSFRARLLPDAVPGAAQGEFRVLLVSCFAQHQDRTGRISRLTEHYSGGLCSRPDPDGR